MAVINGSSNQVIASVPVGANPKAVAVNPVTNKIYVANSFDGTVTVVDGSSNSVIKTIPGGGGAGQIGAGPLGIAVDTSANRIYVANYGPGTGQDTVSIIDGASDSVSTTLTVPTGPSYVAVSSATHKVYVGCSSVIQVINGLALGPTIAQASGGLDFDSAAGLFVSLGGNGTQLLTVNSATDSLSSTFSLGVSVSGLAVAADSSIGKVLVANQSSKTMLIVNESSGAVTTGYSTDSTSVGGFQAIAVNPSTSTAYIVVANSSYGDNGGVIAVPGIQ